MADTTNPTSDDQTVWHVTVPVIALIAAGTAEEAEAALVRALERDGFHAYDQDRNVFESEPVEEDFVGVPERKRCLNCGTPR